MKKIYRSFWKTASVFLFLLITATAFAQRHVVTGTIKDTDGGPFPGVNVVIKGTTVGTATDGDGKFSIEAANEDILVISFIGYASQEIQVGAQTNIDVVLAEDVSTLSEVVVVGYGEMKRTDLSSAQTSVSADQISKTINTTLEQAIQGRAANVMVTQNSGQPGGGISVNIRGISSLNGNNEPLYIIDGVQMESGTGRGYGFTSSGSPMSSLNPSDIESLEILQGPSATAIYGSRASNGVILITTKRGKAGETKLTYSFMYSMQEPPKELPTMNLKQYAEFDVAFAESLGREPRDQFVNPDLLTNGTNWQDALYRSVPMTKHQVGLQGGNEKTTFYLSAESMNQEGVALGSGFTRNGLRLNLENQTRKWLKISTSLQANQTRTDFTTSQDQVIVLALSYDPSIPVKNADGSWGGPGQEVEFSQAAANPIALATINKRILKESRVLGNGTVDITPIKGLLLRTELSGNFSFARGDQWEPSYTFGSQPKTNRTAFKDVGTSVNWRLNTLAQYNKKFGEHDLTVMVGHEANESMWEGFDANLQGHINNNLPEFGNAGSLGDPNTARVGSYKGHNALESYYGRLGYIFQDKYILQGTYRADASSNFGPRNQWAYFPSVSVAWRASQESFLSNVSQITNLKLRLEAGVTGNQGSYSYFSNLNAISTAFGPGFYAANYDNPGLQWERTKNYNIGLDLGLWNNRVQFTVDAYLRDTDNLLMTLPLPDLHGSGNINNPAALGAPPVNIGSMENKGYGLTLTTVNIEKPFTWETNLNFSVFKNQLTELYSQTAFLQRTHWFMPNFIQRSAVGSPVWQFYMYEKEGLWTSESELMESTSAIPEGNTKAVASTWVGDIRYKDQLTEDTNGDGIADAGDGVINDKDQVIRGNPWPKFTFGITNNFKYKNWSLGVLLTGSYGAEIFNYMRFRFESPYESGIQRNRFEEAYNFARLGVDENGQAVVTNPETRVPRLQGGDPNGNNNRATTDYIEDGSYIRIKSVQLAYSIPQSLISKTRILNKAKIMGSVQNLATFTKYKGYDPEIGTYVGFQAGQNSGVVGVDYGRYPQTRIYSFTLELEF